MYNKKIMKYINIKKIINALIYYKRKQLLLTYNK